MFNLPRSAPRSALLASRCGQSVAPVGDAMLLGDSRMDSKPGRNPIARGALDSDGQLLFDPSANVLGKVEDSVKRIDDLLEALEKQVEGRLDSTNRENALRQTYAKEIREMIAVHTREIRELEAKRIDANRQVDLTNSTASLQQMNVAVQALAVTTKTTSETLAAQFNLTMSEITKRLAAVEQRGWEGIGKEKVADPISARMADAIEKLAAFQASTTGRKEGISTAMALAMSVATLLIGALGVLGISFVMKGAG